MTDTSLNSSSQITDGVDFVVSCAPVKNRNWDRFVRNLTVLESRPDADLVDRGNCDAYGLANIDIAVVYNEVVVECASSFGRINCIMTTNVKGALDSFGSKSVSTLNIL